MISVKTQINSFKFFSLKVLSLIIFCSLLSFAGYKYTTLNSDNPIIIPPNQNTLLDKIVARIHPQNRTLATTSLLPVSFSDSNLEQKFYNKNLSPAPIRKIYLSKNASVQHIWEKILNQDPVDSTLLIQALNIVHSPIEIKKNILITVAYNNINQVSSLSWRTNSNQKIKISRNLTSGFVAEYLSDIPVVKQRTVSGYIYSSLIDSAQQLDIAYSTVDDVVDLLGDKIDFRRDLRVGDSFAIILNQEQYSDGSWGKPVELLAAGLINKGNLKAITRVADSNGKYHNFDETGAVIGDYFLQYPVKFTRVSSVFTDSRLHPVLKVRRPHNGVDFAAPTGTPVRSVGAGKIEKIGYFGAAGNMIKISHSKRWSTAYMHLSKFDKNLKVGSKIDKGQIIGAVGCTGLCSGPHLHFSLYDNNKYVDPIKTKLPGVIDDRSLPSTKIIMASLNPLKEELEKRHLAFNKDSNKSKS